MRGLGDLLQNAAQGRCDLVVAANALNILAVIANVEVTNREVDQLLLVAGSSVERSKACLVGGRPRVVLGHESAEVGFASLYGLRPPKRVSGRPYALLKLNNLVSGHMLEFYHVGQA